MLNAMMPVADIAGRQQTLPLAVRVGRCMLLLTFDIESGSGMSSANHRSVEDIGVYSWLTTRGSQGIYILMMIMAAREEQARIFRH